jgi:hypothetical protein
VTTRSPSSARPSCRDFPPYLLTRPNPNEPIHDYQINERTRLLEGKVQKLAELGHVMLKVITLQEMEIRALYDTLQRMAKEQALSEDPGESGNVR